MRLPSTVRCKSCGALVPVEEALEPPKAGEQAKDKPCKCGATNWEKTK